MKIMKTIKLLCLLFAVFYVNIGFGQLNRVFNTDTLFRLNGNWSTKIDTVYVPFDTTTVILKFDESSKNQVIDLLQTRNWVLIDSLYEYKLFKLDSNWTFSKSLDTAIELFGSNILELNTSGILTSNPNDPLFVNQKNLNGTAYANITAYGAWNKGYGNSNVIVAVIDQFPDWGHEDIGLGADGYDNIWKNPKEDAWTNPNDPTSGDHIDNDGNGLIDDWKGWDFRYMDNDTRPESNLEGHGTQIEGIIAAKTNNNVGIAGIAGGNNDKGVSIMPLNILKKNSDGGMIFTRFDLAKALNYAAINNADIISLSLTLGAQNINQIISPLLDDIFNRIYNEYNVLVFCSSGNYTSGLIQYPASHQLVFSVGGINESASSNIFTKGDYVHGRILDFVALAQYMYSLDPSNNYKSGLWGTSYASPQASGSASLILSSFPCLTNKFVYQIMKESGNRGAITITNSNLGFKYDNETNSDFFGYGIPDPNSALDLLEGYIIPSQSISTEVTYNSPSISKMDIIIENGGELTVTSELYMSEDKKIIVEPGGNLIIDGGKITSGCGWQGIEVYGIANTEQNSSTFGAVQIKNEGLVENALIGIHSFDGGIVKSNTDAKFRNNNQSIVFEKSNQLNVYSQISNTKFLSDGPIIRLLKGSSGRIQGMKEFIRINESSKINITNCDFTNTFSVPKNTGKGLAINMYNDKSILIEDCQFLGLSKGINFVSSNGLLNYVRIQSNSFNHVWEPIRVFNSRACVIDNTISLPSNADVLPYTSSYGIGIYTHGSFVKILGNNISTFDLINNTYGTVVRNSKSKYKSLMENNSYENLEYGSQFEGNNRKLVIRCNNYSSISGNAWSVNPISLGSNSFSSQGEFTDPRIPTTKRAGNLFYDRDLFGKPYNHIRSTIGFEYSAANSPAIAIPEYVTSNVNVLPYNEANSLTCLDNPLSCTQNIWSISELYDLIANITDLDSLPLYNEYLIDKLLESDEINDVLNFLATLSDTLDYKESLIGTFINLEDYSNANNVLSSYVVSTDRDQDYFNYYTNLIDRELNEIPKDSITITEMDMFNDIMIRNNDISDLIRAYLNFHCDSNYLILPEQWAEEESRPLNNPTPDIFPKISKELSVDAKLYPNPVNNELKVQFNSNEYEFLDMIFINPIGEIVLEYKNIANQKIKTIDTNHLPSGVYQVKLVKSNEIISNHKLVVIH